MKLLFVAFEFPPLASGGVRRPAAFAKYLPEFGISPVVITTDIAGAKEQIDAPFDSTLLDGFPPDIPVERIPCPARYKGDEGRFTNWRRIYFSLVEQQAKCWRPQLEKRLPEIIRRHRPEAIWVTLPPFGMGPLWCDMAKRHGLPLFIDFRDAWSQWNVSPYGSWFHYYLTLRLERRCLEAAARVLCSSDQIRADLLKVHPGIAEEKLLTITNGYDEEITDWSLPAAVNGARFVIGYVGNFYYSPSAREAMMAPWWRKKPNRMIQYAPRKEDWLYRSPYFFFSALADLLQRRPELRGKVAVRFAGLKPDWFDGQVAMFGLDDVVDFMGFLEKDKVMEFQEQCDALLVTSSKVVGGNDYSIAGKTFEYFSMRRPILGFVAQGAQKDILEKSGMAVVCDPDDLEASSLALGRLVDGDIWLIPNAIFLNSLHRRVLTKKLADVIRCGGV